MSANENETIADIVAKARKSPPPSKWTEWVELLDHIEAAWKREHGNAAAMREALVKIERCVNSLDEECGVDPIEVRDIARAALAKPPRNCDRFGGDCAKIFDAYVLERKLSGTDLFPDYGFWLLAKVDTKGESDGSK